MIKLHVASLVITFIFVVLFVPALSFWFAYYLLCAFAISVMLAFSEALRI
jgi:uncharacterized membrane protein (DUF106 family)